MVELVEINSKPYGKVKVKQNQFITFPSGLLGFESLTHYYLLDKDEGPFFWLQSAEVTEVAFIVINPLYFKSDYKLELSRKDFLSIGISSDKDAEENLVHFVIVTIPQDDPSDVTANLLGPVIINRLTRIGRQALSLDPEHNVKHRILTELEGSNKREK